MQNDDNLSALSFTPRYAFLTKGMGRDRHKLASFEQALRGAGVEKQNLVTVSSIFPPGCKIVSREKGLKMLSPGQITFCVMARQATNEPSRLIVSSIGLAIPNDRSQYGYLSEHHAFGETDERAGDLAEDLAASMLASTLNIEFDTEKAWDEKEEVFKLSNKIIRTTNITQSAQGHKDGLWTSVSALCVLVP
ncbi:MAG: arginine decarboxylase, pyruvoyl-dependent [bacterium]